MQLVLHKCIICKKDGEGTPIDLSAAKNPVEKRKTRNDKKTPPKNGGEKNSKSAYSISRFCYFDYAQSIAVHGKAHVKIGETHAVNSRRVVLVRRSGIVLQTV